MPKPKPTKLLKDLEILKIAVSTALTTEFQTLQSIRAKKEKIRTDLHRDTQEICQKSNKFISIAIRNFINPIYIASATAENIVTAINQATINGEIQKAKLLTSMEAEQRQKMVFIKAQLDQWLDKTIAKNSDSSYFPSFKNAVHKLFTGAITRDEFTGILVSIEDNQLQIVEQIKRQNLDSTALDEENSQAICKFYQNLQNSLAKITNLSELEEHFTLIKVLDILNSQYKNPVITQFIEQSSVKNVKVAAAVFLSNHKQALKENAKKSGFFQATTTPPLTPQEFIPATPSTIPPTPSSTIFSSDDSTPKTSDGTPDYSSFSSP